MIEGQAAPDYSLRRPCSLCLAKALFCFLCETMKGMRQGGRGPTGTGTWGLPAKGQPTEFPQSDRLVCAALVTAVPMSLNSVL